MFQFVFLVLCWWSCERANGTLGKNFKYNFHFVKILKGLVIGNLPPSSRMKIQRWDWKVHRGFFGYFCWSAIYFKIIIHQYLMNQLPNYFSEYGTNTWKLIGATAIYTETSCFWKPDLLAVVKFIHWVQFQNDIRIIYALRSYWTEEWTHMNHSTLVCP